MSDSNRIGMSYIAESTFGVTPSGSLQRMRITGETLRQDTQSVASDEIDPTRQIAEFVRTGINATGGINYEMSYGTHDVMLASALGSAGWSSAVTVGPIATIDFELASGGTQVINDSGNGLAGLLVNGWVKISGSSEAANNGFFKVTASAAGTITVANPDGVVDAAGDSVTIILGAQIVNGVALSTYSIEREYTDLANTLAAFTGMAMDKFSLNTAVGSILSGAMDWLGIKEESKSSTIGTGYTPAPTTKAMNPIDHVKAVIEGGTSLGVRSVNFAFNNNLRQRLEVGILGPESLGQGEFMASGTLEAYFKAANSALVDKYLNWTDTSLAQKLQDTAGNAYVLDCPLVKVTSGPRNTPGKNQDTVASLNWAASKHPTEGITTRIVRFPV